MRSIACVLAALLLLVPEAAIAADVICLTASPDSRGRVSLSAAVRKSRCRSGEIRLRRRRRGLPGVAGPQGAPGATGAAGLAGAAGAKGADGAPGSTGASGVPGIAGPTGATGAMGASGSPGAPGNVAVYGDGSAGPLAISGLVDWVDSPPADHNTNFTTCSVAAGASWVVPSGTVIRCTDAAVIQGEIVVDFGATAGRAQSQATDFTSRVPVVALPGVGSAAAPPSAGEIVRVGTGTAGGAGGFGGRPYLDPASILAKGLVYSFLRGPVAGGGGGAASLGESAFALGGAGGGSLVVIAQGALTVTSSGVIEANGQEAVTSCSGGGGGGVVLLASGVSVSNQGSISALGGAGESDDVSCASGGGGGGGAVVYIAPVQPGDGDPGAHVEGGVTGAASAVLSGTVTRQGGGGGGASAGAGGGGGSVFEDAGSDFATSGADGDDGIIVGVAANPAVLLVP